MSDTSSKRALKNDRDHIRSLASRLAENGPDATPIAAAVERTRRAKPPEKGGILEALCRSPLVGTDLGLSRPVTQGRKIDR